jgi:hypothetical protein
VRQKIGATKIANRLEDHVHGRVELSSSQVTAALGLLRKVVPDLSATQITGQDGGPLIHKAVVELVSK